MPKWQITTPGEHGTKAVVEGDRLYIEGTGIVRIIQDGNDIRAIVPAGSLILRIDELSPEAKEERAKLRLRTGGTLAFD